jgi:16S rRNA (cytosine967-C5)-methyltransferase
VSSPARAAALTAVRRTFEDGAYTHLALESAARGLDRRDRALATRLAYGAVQRKATLDHIADVLTDQRHLQPEVRAVLRVALYELLFSAAADHATVNEAVELAKAQAPRAAGLVNAVMRRATREGSALLDALTDDQPASAALKHSVPVWLAELWWEALGPEEARHALAQANEPAEAAIRVNTLVADPADVATRLPARPATGLPEGLVLDAPFDVHGSDLYARGAIVAQSRAAMTVARTLDPQPGERVLDLCAAPGGKTTHLAALMGNDGHITAVEQHPGRAKALQKAAERARATIVHVDQADAAQPRPPGDTYDRILLDPPCSGLGTLQSRPDLRWRMSPDRIQELAELQRRMLDTASRALGPTGTLVYSVCTISPAESDPEHKALRRETAAQTLPHRDKTDGFFIARFCPSAG